MTTTGHFMSGYRPLDLLRTLHDARYDIEPQYRRRLLQMVVRGLPTWPIAALEQTLYHHKIARTELAGPPIFLLGHWRSGTTHLHNLLSQDPQFGYLSTFDAIATNTGLIARERIRQKLSQILPATRPMDDMPLRMELPQEEEFAMGNVSTLSYYKLFVFPKLAAEYADRYVFFKGPHAADSEVWKRDYDFLLRRITLVMGRRVLVLKNPPNTARLRYLLELYPEAKVIYIYRDPVTVYTSTLRMRERMGQQLQFHDVSREALSAHILDMYPRLLGRFFADLPRVRPGHLVALHYDELSAHPLAALERIYAALGLSGFGPARERFVAYLDTLGDFRAAEHRPDPETQRLVEKRWAATDALHHRLLPG